MTTTIHLASINGFQNAAYYDEHRPSYPVDAVDSLLKHLQVHGLSGACILDLAAGTGKFTKQLADRVENYEIIAIEPHGNMRNELEKKNLKGVRVLNGEAQDMKGLDSQSVDAVVASQSFHWFANFKALAEIHRILSPGGVFGMIWNIEDYNAPLSWVPATKWEGELKALTWSTGNDDARFRHEQWRQVFAKQLESNPFGIQLTNPLFSLPLGEESTEWTHWLSREAIWNRYHTLSQFAVLKDDQLKDAKQRVLELMSTSEVELNEQGHVALHGHTFFAWTTAIPEEPLNSST